MQCYRRFYLFWKTIAGDAACQLITKPPHLSPFAEGAGWLAAVHESPAGQQGNGGGAAGCVFCCSEPAALGTCVWEKCDHVLGCALLSCRLLRSVVLLDLQSCD